MMCLALAYSSLSSFLVLHAEKKGVEGIDLYFTVYAVTLLISRPMVGKLSEKFGGTKVLCVTVTAFAIGLYIVGIANNLGEFLSAAIIIAFGYGACQPLIQALCIQSVPPERRGSASATSYYGTDLGYLAAPIISGQLVERFGYSTMFCCMSVLPLIGLGLLLVFQNKIVPYSCAATSDGEI